MKKGLIIIFFIMFLSFSGRVFAQALQFTVTINSDQLVGQQKTDPQSMSQLQTYMNDFLNNTRWTDDVFEKQERIQCKLNVSLIRSPAQGSYEGTAQLVIARPVFNSNYETVLFTYIDKNFAFNYLPSTQLYFNESSYTAELPYILAFYAYTALTFDYDSFSKLGGTPYLQKAFNLVNQARNASTNQRGWNPTGNPFNRYNLVENLMSPQFLPFREGMYTYYRQGLDIATQNPVEARKNILSVLTTVNDIAKLRTASVVINSFLDAKSDELFKVLIEATPEQRMQAYTLLVTLDASRAQKYQRLSQ